MGRWQKNTEHWLLNEEQGLDDAADAAFQHVFAAVPAVEPSSDFVQRTVEAAWRARTRRRRIVLVSGLAASVLVALTAYGVFGIAGGRLLTIAAAVATNFAASLVAVGTTAVEWWFAFARASSAVAGIVATPQNAVVLLSIELVGIAALYMLQRLLRAEVRFRGPGALCF